MLKDKLEERLNSFCAFLQQFAGRPVMKLKRGTTPQFDSPYLAVGIDTIKEEPNSLLLDSGGIDLGEKFRSIYSLTFLVQAIGGTDAQDCLVLISSLFESENFEDWCENNNSGFSEIQEIVNTSTQLSDASWENRFEFKVTLYTCIEYAVNRTYFVSEEVKLIEPEKRYEETITTSL